MKLHEAIKNVLLSTDEPLTVRDITQIIKKRNLWVRPTDKKFPEVEQVSARVNNYKKMFSRKNSIVTLNHAHVEIEEVFTRLTYNENDWIVPSGHNWKKENQSNANIKFENQYGFGLEEWLFNPRYLIDGYQYGYIRGLAQSNSSIIRKVHLYTLRTEVNNSVLYLGTITDVEVLDGNWKKEYPNVLEVFEENESNIKNEIKQINGDINGLSKEAFYPVVRFKLENIDIETENPTLVEGFPLSKYKRFKPYKITDEISTLFLDGELEEEDVYLFKSGKASQTSRYERHSNASSKSVIKLHCEIVDAVEKYLAPEFSLQKNNISIETTRFRGNIADIVTKKDNDINIFEVKTNPSARRNIRDAISQLLDYAVHSGDNVTKIVIVSPAPLNSKDLSFFKNLKNVINFQLEYLEYSKDTKEIKKYE